MNLVGRIEVGSGHRHWRPRPCRVNVACVVLAVGLLSSAVSAAPPVRVDGPVLLDRLGPAPLGRGTFVVGGNRGGLVVMAWLATPTLVQARVYDAFGAPRTPILEVTREARYGTQLALDVDDAGGFVLVWQAGPGLVARRYGGDGSPAAGTFVVTSGAVTTTDVYVDFVCTLVWMDLFSPLGRSMSPSHRMLTRS